LKSDFNKKCTTIRWNQYENRSGWL